MSYGDSVAVYGAKDCKMRPITSDPLGGTTLFGDWIDVPAINDCQIDLDLVSAESEGDDETVAVASRVKSFKGKIGMGLESMEVFKTMVGGTLARLGSSPNQTSEWLNSKGDRGQKFEIVVQSSGDDDSPDSTIERTFYKCTLTKFSNGSSGGKFSGPGIEFTAISRKSDGKRVSTKCYETGADLSSGSPDTTPPTVTSVTPADGATGVALTGIVAFTFSEDMDKGTISDPGTYYYANATSGNAVAFTVSVAGNVATLTPAANIATGVVHLVGVTKAAKDKAGNRLAAQYAINFTAV